MSRETLLPRHNADEFNPNEERRGDVRRAAQALAQCRLVSEESSKTWTARTRDCSSLGVGLILPEKLERGVLLDIDLENRKGTWVTSVRARVIHVEDASGGAWFTGCAFISELDNAEMRLFQAEKVRSTSADGRRWARFPCDVETICYTCATTPGERRRAHVINVSAGGMGLVLPCEFPVGTLFRLELPAAVAQPARLLLLRVIHCAEQQHGNWFLGCEFAHQLGEAELRSLLI